MSDDPKDPPVAESTEIDSNRLDPSPAVHSDALWGGPRFIENASAEPVWVETKEEFWALMRQNGVRVKGQQESTTGAPQSAAEEHVDADKFTPPVRPVVAPFSKDEAHLFGAMTAVFRRYGLIETIWCEDCGARGEPSGCRMHVGDRRVAMSCRCGTAVYLAPGGTTDLVLRSLPHMTHGIIDDTAGAVETPLGMEFRPTTMLQPVEAFLIQNYIHALRARHKEPRLFHQGCFDGHPHSEETALAVNVTSSVVMLICKCRMLVRQVGRRETVN